MTSGDEGRWSIVLAGGRGARLASLTTVAGETIPKQYCSLAGGPSIGPAIASAPQGARRSIAYERPPSRDFSKAVLERAPESLAVVTARPCGWSDLGNPERVARCLRPRTTPDLASAPFAAALDLSQQIAGGSCGASAR